MPRTVSAAQLAALQHHPERVRNICILAHVDHGKTTLADALVASNGVISARLAGRLRYLDSRPDEQRRGITMKSSAIALHHTDAAGGHHLINLIDSPGHVDFSSEVSTAVRLCDGAVVLVDCVEGVCAQTKAVLRQAWTEGIRPVLVLNKIDRLVLELGLSPLSAHFHLTQVLEQVNAVMAELFTTDFLERPAAAQKTPVPSAGSPADGPSSDPATRDMADWSTGLEDVDDSSVYFSPDAGNVLFASAYDGWGFGIKHFSKIYSEKLGIREDVLLKTLWGDYYLNAKTKRIMKGAQEKAKTPLFVQFILQNVWAVYEAIAVRRDKEMTEKIIASLKLTVSARDLRSTDSRVQLQAVFSQWLPLATASLDMVVAHLPPAAGLSEERAERLLAGRGRSFDQLPPETRALRPLFTRCSGGDDVPVIVFVSKMMAVDRAELPENRARPLTAEEMAQRREEARRRHAARAAAQPNNEAPPPLAAAEVGVPLTDDQMSALRQAPAAAAPIAADPRDVFVAFARVFSGTLRPGQRLLVLGPKHEPAAALRRLAAAGAVPAAASLAELAAGEHITECRVGPLYLLMGRALEELAEAPAGCVVGIGGLADHVLKSATLSTTVACPAFSELSSVVLPIVRVAVEPARPADMPQLVAGLRLLNQADACVRVSVQESGEHVLVTAGEVHLQRCLDDLRERFAGVEVVASQPIVPFRETIVEPPQVDMVNEAIEGGRPDQAEECPSLVEVTTPGRQATVAVRAEPLPADVTELLDASVDLLASLHKGRRRARAAADEQDEAEVGRPRPLADGDGDGEEEPEKSETELSEKSRRELHQLALAGRDEAPAGAVSWERAARCRDELRRRLRAAGRHRLAELVDRVWSFGPRRCGPNLLLNAVSDYERPSVWEPEPEPEPGRQPQPLAAFDDSVVQGFQLATAAGPLCQEPMRGVCFVVEALALRPPDGAEPAAAHGPLSGQIMSAVLTACRRAFQAQPQRLMAAMYQCQVQVTGQALGRMYSVIGRRGGRVVHGDLTEGSHSFSVTAYVPVVESFSLAQELRKETSGLAAPQLVFSHWETLDTDPFWVPTTEEEYLLFGQKADTENAARRHMNAVRRRKGLPVDEKIVEFGEKQRTLARKK